MRSPILAHIRCATCKTHYCFSEHHYGNLLARIIAIAVASGISMLTYGNLLARIIAIAVANGISMLTSTWAVVYIIAG